MRGYVGEKVSGREGQSVCVSECGRLEKGYTCGRKKGVRGRRVKVCEKTSGREGQRRCERMNGRVS